MTITSTRPVASRRNSTFARAAVFAEFSARDARRGLDQAGFIDRHPDQVPRKCTPPAPVNGEAILERLAETLRQVDDDAQSPTAAVRP